MIYGIGTDICDIKRIEENLEKFGEKFVRRILTQQEIGAAGDRLEDAAFIAKRFAAKEACSKALKVGIGKSLSFLDIVVEKTNDGAPTMHLIGIPSETFNGIRLHVSLSDEAGLAHAYVIAEEV